MLEYDKRLVEVDEVLNYLSKDNLNKIPEDVRQAIKVNKNKEYVWKYDETKPLKEQNLNRDTIIILSYLNMEYLLNEEQKALMEQIFEQNEKKANEEKRNQFKYDDLFKKENDSKTSNSENENIQIVEYKENFFTKFKRFILSLFHKN